MISWLHNYSQSPRWVQGHTLCVEQEDDVFVRLLLPQVGLNVFGASAHT